jgi:hypothetical protein
MTDKPLTMPALAKLHQAMTDQLRGQLARLRAPQDPRAAGALATVDLGQAQKALAAAQGEHDVAMKNWDDRLTQLRERVALLQQRQAEIAPQAGRGASSSKVAAAAAAKPKPKR